MKKGLMFLMFVMPVLMVTVGCDPVRTTVQDVRLKIIDSAPGNPAVGAQVWLKYDYEKKEPGEWMKGWTPEDSNKFMKTLGDTMPWYYGVVSPSGQAVIGVKNTMLDRTRGHFPPHSRDMVSGKPYLITVKNGQAYEEFALVMRLGESVRGKSFTVSVDSPGEPYYVEGP
jgi:hypothetical protein